MGKMGPLMTYALADFQPPLYHLIGWLITSIAGHSELALRTPSLLAGVGTVYFATRIGELLGGKKVMYIAGLITATNPLLIYYSQEGRTYGLTTFFVTAAMFYFIKTLKSPARNSLILYGLFSVLFLWTSYLTWFLHLILFVYTLFLKRRDILISQVISGATLIYWLPSLYKSLQVGLSTVNNSPAWGNVVGGISVKALVLTWVKAVIGRISFTPTWIYGTVVALVFILHSRVLLALKNTPTPLLVWLGSIPALALFSLLLPVYSYTRLLFVVPAYLLILSLSLSKLNRVWSQLIILAQLLFLVVFWTSPTFHREDWQGVVSDYGRSATYALPSRTQNAPLMYYGISRSNIFEPKIDSLPQVDKIIYIKYVEDVFDVTRKGINNLTSSGYTLKSQQIYPGLQVDVYENNN